MQPHRLLDHVASEHRPRVERLYEAFAGTKRSNEGDDLDTFAHSMHEMGLLSTRGLQDFLTYHELTLKNLEDTTALEPRASSYRLKALLGRGAMGEVFLGRDPSLQRTVAVKRVHDRLRNDRSLLQRFVTEAQVTAQLDHPAIVPIYGFEKDPDGTLAYAMKFVRGVTLTAYADEARQQIEADGRTDAAHSLKARIETFIPVLNAIAYAHRRGVIHRDLKPDNVMVGSFGEVLVMDWGIARVIARPDASVPPAAADPIVLERGADPGLTLPGMLLGTPAFMSPEQAAGVDLDAASDQYTLGLILQEVVTLRPAVSATTLEEMLTKAQDGQRDPIVATGEPIARELAAIIGKATAPAKADRYASVEALADDLRRFLRDESVRADPDRGLRRFKRWIGRNRGLAMASGAGLMVLMFATVAFVLWQSQVALEREREAARRRDIAISEVAGVVDARAQEMSAYFFRYEALLEGLAATARLALSEPAPPSGAVVYTYKNEKLDPPQIPADAKSGKAFWTAVSVRHPSYSGPPELDREALRPSIDQLARLEPAMRATLLRSLGEDAAELPIERAEELILETGVPLRWVTFVSALGITVNLPGIWFEYDPAIGTAYVDSRLDPWYPAITATRRPVWNATASETCHLLFNGAQAVRDPQGNVLGVAALAVSLMPFIDAMLEIPALQRAGAESILLDSEQRLLVRSTTKEHARSQTVYDPILFEQPELRSAISAQSSGHLTLGDGRLALWSSITSGSLTYLVVGPEQALLEVAAQ